MNIGLKSWSLGYRVWPGEAVEHCSEGFVGIDVAKARNAIAIADGERGGAVRFVGEVDASGVSMRRVVKRPRPAIRRISATRSAPPRMDCIGSSPRSVTPAP